MGIEVFLMYILSFFAFGSGMSAYWIKNNQRPVWPDYEALALNDVFPITPDEPTNTVEGLTQA